jgi:hypothetical protein
LIKEYQPIHEINESRISLLLEHESWAVRLKAIEILGKVQDKQALFRHLGKGEDFEDNLIIHIFRLIGESAIPELKQAQKNPVGWIREEATDALIFLGVDTVEPDLIEDHILCPKCQEKNTISFSKSYDEIKVLKTNFIKELVRKSNIRIRCSSCNSELGIKLEVSKRRSYALKIQQSLAKPRRDGTGNDNISHNHDPLKTSSDSEKQEPYNVWNDFI